MGELTKILSVDDDLDFLESLKKNLELEPDYQVCVLGDLLEALEVFQAAPDGFDIVTTDKNMPEMSGVELIEEIRIIRPDIAIAMCSAQPIEIDGVKTFEKPFPIDDLRSWIDGIITEARP
jgi:DNA-binding response OmpR family regulator